MGGEQRVLGFDWYLSDMGLTGARESLLQDLALDRLALCILKIASQLHVPVL